MPYFEITGVGFDASTDATDHKVLWVWAPDRSYLDQCIGELPIQAVSDLEDFVGVEQALDFSLPSDALALRAKLCSP